MKQRLLTMALLAGCIVMGAAAFLLNAGQDRKAPRITIEDEEISYAEGDKYDVLLEGVSAKDNRDGDVTDEIFVEKIVPVKEGYAEVYYGVTDSNNNVATAHRTVSYTEEASEKEEKNEPEPDSEESAMKEKTEEETKEPENDEDSDAEDEELKPDGSRPAIALAQSEVTIKRGESFDPLSVVKGVVDDKDDRNRLYQRISADGEKNTNKAGTYSIRYYVKDSDGNTSDVKELTLKVE